MEEYKSILQNQLSIPFGFIPDTQVREILSIADNLKAKGFSKNILREALLAQKKYELVKKYDLILSSKDITIEEALYVLAEKNKNNIMKSIADMARDENIEIMDIKRHISSLSTLYASSSKKDMKSMTNAFLDALHQAEGNRIRTGWKDYDDTVWQEKDRFIVVGGASGSGKTTFALNLICKMCSLHRDDIAICFLSLEMSENRILEKLFSRALHATVKQLRTKIEDYSDYLLDVKNEIDSWPLHIHYTGTDIENMEMIANQFLLENPDKTCIFILDHIGEIEGGSLKDSKQLTDAATRMLKDLCRQGAISIALTQLRKDLENSANKANLYKPSDDYIMNSQMVKARADIVLHTWRPEHYGIYEWHQEDGSLIKEWDLRNTMFLVNTKNRDDSTSIIPFNCYMGHNLIKDFDYSKLRALQ